MAPPEQSTAPPSVARPTGDGVADNGVARVDSIGQTPPGATSANPATPREGSARSLAPVRATMPSPGVAEGPSPAGNSADAVGRDSSDPTGPHESRTGVNIPGSLRTSHAETNASTEQRVTGRGGATTLDSTEGA
eukprot:1738384-Pyramimonas_sp.AAC.1